MLDRVVIFLVERDVLNLHRRMPPSSNRDLERLQRRGREPERLEEADDGRLLAVVQGAHRGRPLGAKVRHDRVEHLLAQIAAAKVRMDPEGLDPAARRLDPELARAHVAEHEADDLALDLGYTRRFGVAGEVKGPALLPEIGPILPADPLVNPDDGVDVELVEGPDAGLILDVGHGRLSSGDPEGFDERLG